MIKFIIDETKLRDPKLAVKIIASYLREVCGSVEIEIQTDLKENLK